MSMKITPSFISLKNTDIPTKNITEISVEEDAKHGELFVLGLLLGLVGVAVIYAQIYPLTWSWSPDQYDLLLLIAGVAAVAYGLGLVVRGLAEILRPLKHQLVLQTSAGKVTALQSKDLQFLQAVQERIREVINASGEVSTYSINVDNKTIQEGNKVHVSDSQGVNVVGGAATNVSQTAEVHGAAMKDLTALIAQLDSLGQADTQEMKQLLSDVRMYLAGAGKSKEDAKRSWDQFVERLGKAADVTDDIWSLVVKIGAAVT
jgi:hypothetical protein